MIYDDCLEADIGHQGLKDRVHLVKLQRVCKQFLFLQVDLFIYGPLSIPRRGSESQSFIWFIVIYVRNSSAVMFVWVCNILYEYVMWSMYNIAVMYVLFVMWFMSMWCDVINVRYSSDVCMCMWCICDVCHAARMLIKVDKTVQSRIQLFSCSTTPLLLLLLLNYYYYYFYYYSTTTTPQLLLLLSNQYTTAI